MVSLVLQIVENFTCEDMIPSGAIYDSTIGAVTLYCPLVCRLRDSLRKSPYFPKD